MQANPCLETPLAEMPTRFLKGRNFAFVRKKTPGMGEKRPSHKQKRRRRNATVRCPRCTQPSRLPMFWQLSQLTRASKGRRHQTIFTEPVLPTKKAVERKGVESQTTASLADSLQVHGELAVSHATKRMVSNADQRGMDTHCFSTWGIPRIVKA